MGHYDEPDHVYEKREALETRRDKATRKLFTRKLADFTFEDLEIFINVFCPSLFHEFNEDDAQALEKLADK